MSWSPRATLPVSDRVGGAVGYLEAWRGVARRSNMTDRQTGVMVGVGGWKRGENETNDKLTDEK